LHQLHLLHRLHLMSVIDSARRTLRTHGLLPPGSRVAVALSGGADSVALLVVLRELAGTEGFRVVGAAHLNHQLRGADADADAQFCRNLAAGFEMPIEIEQVDVGAIARETGASIEHAGHTARYAFFERAAARLDATAVAVAHTKDDQAETFLLRLLRGAGPRGLGGMHPRAGRVVRPFLETTRSDVRDFLRDRHIAFREDQSNADLAIARNRIRHELLPLLDTRFAPGVVEILDREAAIAREDADYLDAGARAAAARLISKSARGVELDAATLLAEPPAVRRRVIRLAQQMAAGPATFVGFDAGEAVLRFLVSKRTGQLDLPGHRVNRRGNLVVLTRSRGRERPPRAPDFIYQLEVPGRVAVPEAACAIAADTRSVPSGRSAGDVWQLAGRSNEAVIEARRLVSPLAVRNRRAGDRFRPLGLHGRKTLQDFFVDAKVDRFEREITPVVVDSSGRIVWVAGHALAEEFRVTAATKDVVILKRLPI
jgi:tRNA(Ile)-lysidine synthase